MEINLKDLYQLLLVECRYGYARNNHLMPDGAYEHVKQYLPLMRKEDKYFAINTAKQLVDECISMQLVDNFYDGEDDRNHSREKALKFIDWLFDFIDDNNWKPYNYDQYLANKALDDKPIYSIYKYNADDDNDILGKKLTDRLLSKNELLPYLINDILKTSDAVVYRKYPINNSSGKEWIFYGFGDFGERKFVIVKEN